MTDSVTPCPKTAFPPSVGLVVARPAVQGRGNLILKSKIKNRNNAFRTSVRLFYSLRRPCRLGVALAKTGRLREIGRHE